MFLPGLGPDVEVSGLERYPKRYADVLGKRMAYVEAGAGDPVVSCTASPRRRILWRNVMPHLEGLGRARSRKRRRRPMRVATPSPSGDLVRQWAELVPG